jgi:hypothetical protein
MLESDRQRRLSQMSLRQVVQEIQIGRTGTEPDTIRGRLILK